MSLFTQRVLLIFLRFLLCIPLSLPILASPSGSLLCPENMPDVNDRQPFRVYIIDFATFYLRVWNFVYVTKDILLIRLDISEEK